jgi:hypothetical protein
VTDADATDADGKRDPVLPKIIAGGAAAYMGTRLDPGAAVLLGMGGYQFESLAQHVWAELTPQARQRTARMLAAAALRLGYSDEQLRERIDQSEENVLMTGLAMSAAERTTWPDKVVVLGRLLADGLIADGDAVLLPQYALNAMVDLERLDVSLLDLLIRHVPTIDPTTGQRWHAELLQPPQGDSGWLFATPHDAMRRQWREDMIASARPELAPVLPGVTGALTRHGLALQVDRTREALEQFSRDLRNQEDRQAATAQRTTRVKNTMPPRSPDISKLARTERTWSPTSLGEIILSYYLDAAEQTTIPAGGALEAEDALLAAADDPRAENG